MESYRYLLDVALILISTKFLGILTKRISMPQVVGALVAGLILGPACFGLISPSDFLSSVSELGVIVLMFTAGLETDVNELKKTGKASFIIALLGVIFPLIGGWGAAYLFNRSALQLQNIFIGVILTATSVSITVETLKELGKMSTKAGNAILGAALIDDILGIIALTIVTSLADGSSNIAFVLLKILAFFLLAGLVGYLFYSLFSRWVHRANKDMRRFVIVAFAFCLIMSFVAEVGFGVADITGAFIAGLIISNCERTKYIASRFDTMSYLLLSPIFFAGIGIKVALPHMTGTIIAFSAVLIAVAILSKIAGCGIGAKLCGFTNKQSLQVGAGMVSRGEVALIVANKGAGIMLAGGIPLMNPDFFGPVIIMIVITTIITPIVLKLVFKGGKKHEDLEESALADAFLETEQLDLVSQRVGNMNVELKDKYAEKAGKEN